MDLVVQSRVCGKLTSIQLVVVVAPVGLRQQRQPVRVVVVVRLGQFSFVLQCQQG